MCLKEVYLFQDSVCYLFLIRYICLLLLLSNQGTYSTAFTPINKAKDANRSRELSRWVQSSELSHDLTTKLFFKEEV